MDRPTLRNPICDFLRIEYPILLAGMDGTDSTAEVFADLGRGARQILDHDLDAMAGTRP